MPDLATNLTVWNDTYDWSQRGDEWSDAWGGVYSQWWATLMPRIQGFVPAGRILEIAPGYGRWTHFLRDLSDELLIVDIAETAIEYCRLRFGDDARVKAYVNDGTSLSMAADSSVDLVFSFDSLVHAEQNVIGGYLDEITRILGPDGVAFIHHSNMGAYTPGSYDPNNIHWRATSVSAEWVSGVAADAGLTTVSQETVAWGNETLLNDCFTVLTPPGSRWERDPLTTANLAFTRDEIAVASRIASQYPPARAGARVAISADAPRWDHGRALELASTGALAEACQALEGELRRAVNPEVLNDLAVLTLQTGRRDRAETLLRALVELFPEHPAGRENLTALGVETRKPKPTRR